MNQPLRTVQVCIEPVYRYVEFHGEVQCQDGVPVTGGIDGSLDGVMVGILGLVVDRT